MKPGIHVIVRGQPPDVGHQSSENLRLLFRRPAATEHPFEPLSFGSRQLTLLLVGGHEQNVGLFLVSKEAHSTFFTPGDRPTGTRTDPFPEGSPFGSCSR